MTVKTTNLSRTRFPGTLAALATGAIAVALGVSPLGHQLTPDVVASPEAMNSPLAPASLMVMGAPLHDQQRNRGGTPGHLDPSPYPHYGAANAAMPVAPTALVLKTGGTVPIPTPSPSRP